MPIRIQSVTVQPGGLEKTIRERAPAAVRRLGQAVLASCEPYVPYRTGRLCRSGELSGAGVRGEIRYTAPYASDCYYAQRPFGKKVHPRACARWLEAARSVDAGAWRRMVAEALTRGNRDTQEMQEMQEGRDGDGRTGR